MGQTHTSPRKPIVARRSGARPADSSTPAAVSRLVLGGSISSPAMSRAPPVIRTETEMIQWVERDAARMIAIHLTYGEHE
jgi:hypothetical protein